MTVNMGRIDKGLRLVLAMVLVYAAFATETLSVGILILLVLAVAAEFTVTALVGTCPRYNNTGIRALRVAW
ncbi:YgaP family membrane protein [Pukyongiella litopenaei]|uniref:DUF2892 domain-containing protein n=1 Tax=Pukyongiella litopenaei TaxID=2605946 RepID=A0A2S0MQV7_9RHOB|nr:DUF2892 domain-containing protein [Pukyongiella litopenaei]AVO38252.1 DUF2892 domain-containing protein [Pukyongiella litopenaei]